MREFRLYDSDRLPYQDNLEKYAPSYIPERFTDEEKSFLNPFFSNVDRPVFVVQHLPEEVIGALSSRYSRSTESLRRMFLTEYVEPIVRPELQKNWNDLANEEKGEAVRTKEKFLQLIEFLNTHGGVDYVVNIQRGRKFFDRWLAEFGDDSIAELGGIHLCIEGLSNIATKEIEDKRLGISPLEKSSRYVSFAEKRADGNYQYVIPGEIKGTPFEEGYRRSMDMLFGAYSYLLAPYVDYIKSIYPKGEDETEKSFDNSRSAKRFDDLRDLLPFSTQTNLALYGNGRAFEDLVNRLMDYPVGELRYWGQAICNELEGVVPSFIRRPKTLRGAEVQTYRTNLKILRDEMSGRLFKDSLPKEKEKWVKLLRYTPDADTVVLSAFLFSGRDSNSFSEVWEKIADMSSGEKKVLLGEILEERRFGKSAIKREEARFRKVPRAFENAHYLFEVWARGGDYRDLHRHRQQTQERQQFTTKWGYDLEKEVLNSPFRNEIINALEMTKGIYQTMSGKISPEIAQYVVPFGFIQHWYMNLSAREIYWITELRTGPQGRPHYRMICQEIARQATEVTPAIFQNLMVDNNDYSLARREAEKRIERRKQVI